MNASAPRITSLFRIHVFLVQRTKHGLILPANAKTDILGLTKNVFCAIRTHTTMDLHVFACGTIKEMGSTVPP